MENSVKKPLSRETRQQLKERLALLKKEYVKTVYKLQRAQKAELVRNHVKNTIAQQNQPLEEQSTTQQTTGESLPFLDMHQSSSSYQKSQVPESNEKKSAVTFNLEPEIRDSIGGPNVALTRMCESFEDPSAEPTFSPAVETGPVTKSDIRVPGRLKLKKKNSGEVLKKGVCEAASELNASLASSEEPSVKEIEELDSAVNEHNAISSFFNRGNGVSAALGRDVKENGSPQGEEDSVPFKNEAQEVEGNHLTSPLGRTMNDTVCCSPGDKSAAVSVCENEAFSSRDPEALAEATRPQQKELNCPKELIEASESNLASEAVASELDRLQENSGLHEASEDSPLNSCTLVEGLLFPVEYYVRTTRRMTSCQRQVDLNAVIHSHLGKCRSGGRGRSRKSTLEQGTPAKGLPKAEGEISDTLLLFNSQEDDFAASNAASSQHHSQYPWNTGVDSHKSNHVKGRKRDRGGSIKPKLTDDTKALKVTEWTLNNHTISDVQRVAASDVHSERESEENENNFCQPVPNTNELFGNTVNKLGGHDFSSMTNFNIKSSNLTSAKPKHIGKPLQDSIESQTSDVLVRPFKENSKGSSTEQRESVSGVPEHHCGLNSDTDSQEMVPETQQDPFLGNSMKKSFNGARQLFPLGIESYGEDTLAQVSQPRRRVRLSKGNCYRRTRAGSRKPTTRLEGGTLTCSEPLLSVKKPVVKKLFHSLEVQDFDLPDEEYGQLKEKLKAESLRKSLLSSQHNIVDCTVETQVETENWDAGHCDSLHSQDIKQATESREEHHPQKSLDHKERSRTPEEPAADGAITPSSQKRPEDISGCKLSSSVLLSTPSCTPQAGNVHQHEQGASSPVFPSLGFTPAFGSSVLSQNNHRNQDSLQTGALSHACEDVQNNDGSCGQTLQTSEGVVPVVNREDTLSAREHLDADEQPPEQFHGSCATKISQSEVLNEDCAVKFAEAGSVIEEGNDDALTSAPSAHQFEQSLKRQTLQLISTLQNPSTSCVTDLCTVFWIVSGTKALCIACACETAVFLWAPQQLNQWTNIHTWAFDKVPIIELIPIPDAVNILCVAFGSLEIREVKALHSTEKGCLERTLLQAGDINAVLGLPGRRLVCSCGTLQSQHIELSTLSKEGRSEQCTQLVPPNEMVLAFSDVEGEAEALLGSTIMSNIVIWSLKTGHLLKKIHLSESYPGTVCQKAYSESGLLFLLLSHRYVGSCDGSVSRRVCVLKMVGVNPINDKSRPVMSYTLPLECNGRYIVGGVKDQSVAAVVTPGTLVLWDVPSGHISTMLPQGPNGHWSLFQWAEANSCLLARKNDRTVYIYKRVGARTV